VANHRTSRVVWGAEGKGQAAADRFFTALDSPSPPPDPTDHAPARDPGVLPNPARGSWQCAGIMVPFGPCPTVLAGDGIPGAWLEPGRELAPSLFARSGRLRAISMDRTGGYAKSVRAHAPHATIVIDNYHVVQLATKALDEVRREHWNELRQSGQAAIANQFKRDRWALLKNPDDLTDTQAATLAAIRTGGGKVARAWAMKERDGQSDLRPQPYRPSRQRTARPAPLSPGPLPPGAVRPARPHDPQAPRGDPRRPPLEN